MISTLVIIIIVLLAAFICVSAISYTRKQEVDSLVKQLHTARKDAGHWYSRVQELEIRIALAQPGVSPNFKGTGRTPKDYEEHQI